MIHAFDTDLAERVGIDAAIIYYHLEYYCQVKEQADEDIYDGKAWVYYSAQSLYEKHPYMSLYRVKRSLNVLLDAGLIVKRKGLNRVNYDRTLWYSVVGYLPTDRSKTTYPLVENHLSIGQKPPIDRLNSAYPLVDIDTSIGQKPPTYTITSNNTSNITSIKKETKAKKDTFKPPTLEQVREYCQDKGYTINPETFIDYYTSNGWHVGKNKMRDWRAAVRTWVNKDKDRKPKSKSLPFDQFLEGEEVSFK